MGPKRPTRHVGKTSAPSGLDMLHPSSSGRDPFGMSTTKRFTCGTLDFENAGRRIFDGAIEAKFPLDALPVKVEWKSVRQTAAAPRSIQMVAPTPGIIQPRPKSDG